MIEKIDSLLKLESQKRAKSKTLQGLSDEFSFDDAKAEFFKINKSMIEFQKALNSGDAKKVQELCYLTNSRLRLIFKFLK